MQQRIARYASAAYEREDPESGLGPLAASQDAEDRGAQGKKADEDDGIGRGDALEGKSGHEREADDHAERDDGKGSEILPLRALLAQGHQHKAR